MATQQFGYGPNVWAPAKGIGVQQFAKLAQPGAVAPQFKAENKYKALAAKAIGEMAYGAMMNNAAKKKKAEEKALTQSLYGDTFEALSGKSGDFMFKSPFEDSVVPTEKDETNTETKSTETAVNFDATNYNKGVAPTHVPVDKKPGGSWSWSREEAPTSIGAALGLKHADFTKGTWVYSQPSGKRNKTTGYK